MATYLQGVTDYIPEFQPFQPDLNFYGNLLQAKQTQYDNNWKSINKIYGQYFYSELSRQDNLEIKDQLMKNIDFNLKRISGLDLSLDQNVQQAVQVFKPFYEDQYLMKDMAWTKNYQNQRSQGLGLKNAKAKEERDRYWNTGIKALDYKREEFREVQREETLGFDNVSYTPYVNALEVYRKVADDWGISYDQTAPDPSGNYMIRQKNGDPIIPTLQTLFQAYGANDPQLQERYFTESYVNRKDYSYQHANEFNGDVKAAEMDYLNKTAQIISKYVEDKNKTYQSQAQTLKSEKDRVEQVIEKNEDNLFTLNYLKRLDEAAGYTDAVAAKTDALDKDINDTKQEGSAQQFSPEQTQDLETLRRKVDSGVAAMLMDGDIATAAYSYSRKGMVYEMKESQRGLEAMRQQNRLAAIEAKKKADQWNTILKHNLETGVWLLDENGNPYPKDLSFYNPNPINVYGPNEPGSKEESQDIKDLNLTNMDETAKLYADDWMQSAKVFVDALYNNGVDSKITKQEYDEIFAPDWYVKGKKGVKQVDDDDLVGFKLFKTLSDPETAKAIYYKKPRDFYKSYTKYPGAFLYGNAESIANTKAKVDGLARKFMGDKSIADNYIGSTIQSGYKMDEFIAHAGAVKAVNRQNTQTIQDELLGDPTLNSLVNGNKTLAKELVKSFYNGYSIINKDDFKKIAESKISTPGDKGYYLSGLSISESEFKNNSLTREEVKKAVFAANSNLTTTQKEGLVNKILYSQKQYAKSGSKKDRYKETQRDRSPLYFAQNDYVSSLNDPGDYAETVYNELKNTYSRVIYDPSKMLMLTPLKSAVDKSGGRVAQFSKGESGVEVHLNAPTTFKPFAEFIQNDLRNIQLGDINNVAISTKGTTKFAFDQTKEQTDADGGAKRDLLYRFINDLYSNIADETKVKPFRFTQRQYAAERNDLGAMVLYPDKETLKQYTATKENPVGFSAQEVSDMLRYGISVIAPRGNFSNSLFRQNMWTPMQMAVKASPNKPVVVTHPRGAGKIEISEVKLGPGDYNIVFTKNILQSDGTVKTDSQTVPNYKYGNRLDDYIQEILRDDLQRVDSHNEDIYRTLSPEAKRKAASSPVFKNVPISTINFDQK